MCPKSRIRVPVTRGFCVPGEGANWADPVCAKRTHHLNLGAPSFCETKGGKLRRIQTPRKFDHPERSTRRRAERGGPMLEISVTDFADFVLKVGVCQIKKAEEIHQRGAYDPEKTIGVLADATDTHYEALSYADAYIASAYSY